MTEKQAGRSGAVDKLYSLVANEGDARACRDISESACLEVPGNFFRVLLSLVLTKAGDLLISPKTVLVWLLVVTGSPAALTALLVPIRESGSMVPQLIIAAFVRRHARRKRFWVVGALLQSAAVLAMIPVALFLSGVWAGVAIIAALMLFSLSRGLCSVAMKDVQGKTIPKGRRGRLTGLAATASGAMAGIVAFLLMAQGSSPDVAVIAAVLALAGLSWVMAAFAFGRVIEEPGETAGGNNAIELAVQSMGLLRTDRAFRHFVVSRALLMGSALSAPFIVMLVGQRDGSFIMLGMFVLAAALASALSAFFWGLQADVSSRRVMIRGGLLASFSSLLAAALFYWLPEAQWLPQMAVVAAFVLAVGHAGVRVGRKTYLLDMAGGVKRTDYVAVSNTVIGLLLLAMGGVSAWLAQLSPVIALATLGLTGLAGTLYSVGLKEV